MSDHLPFTQCPVCAPDTEHPDAPRQTSACSWHPSPQPVPRAPTNPCHHSPEPEAPRQTHGGHPVRVPGRYPRNAGGSGHPTPHFSVFRRAPASLLPCKPAAPARPSPSPASAPGAPLRNRPPRPPTFPERVSPAESPGQGAPPPPPAALPARPKPSAASGARGSAKKPPAQLASWAWAGSGGGTLGSRGHLRVGTRRATRGLAPGPCPGVGGGRLRGGAGLGSAGPPSSWPSGGPVGTRGTTRPELATPHGLRAARGAPCRSRGPGSGAGAGIRGPGGGPGRAVLTAVGDEQAGQDHERPKS